MKTYTCADCRHDFDAEEIINPFTGKELLSLSLCDPCLSARRDKESTAAMDSRMKGLRDKWDEICPAAYQQTRIDDFSLSVAARNGLCDWDYKTGLGIGIIGKSGIGKTRLAFLKLHELHFAGVNVMALSAKRMERHIFDSFSDDKATRFDARSTVERARNCRILFLDDVGKEKATERVSGEFYDMIENRTSRLLPIIWTANANADELASRMGEEYGVPTIRRLIEFSTIITA